MSDKVLVTGGARFIGSHLCELLLQKGHEVVAIDDLSTGRLQNIRHLQPLPHFQFVRETITNAQVLDRLTSEVDTVIRLAAAVGVKLIVENPVHTVETNIMSTEMALNAANCCDFYAPPGWVRYTPPDPGKYSNATKTIDFNRLNRMPIKRRKMMQSCPSASKINRTQINKMHADQKTKKSCKS